MTLTGTGRMVRLVLRRDRLRLPLWIVGIAGLVVASAAALPPVYPDQSAIDAYAGLVGANPAVVVFVGPGYGVGDPTIGFVLVNEIQLYAMIALALMSIFLVNRHTRAEEDVERAELVRSSVVGRHAAAAAAITVVVAANVVIAVISAVGFVALGYAATGSLVLAASLLAVGWVFVGVAAVTVQVASTARAAVGMAVLVLLAAFVLRAVGDVGGNFVRWLSPIGWAQGMRAFAGERWWIFGACVALAAGLVVTGFRLASRRDLGSGLVPARLGPPHAATSLRRPAGLALRLQRGSFLGWLLGMTLMGMLLGSLGEEIGSLIDENPTWGELMAQTDTDDVVDSYFATGSVLLGMASAGFALSAVQRLRTEESAGRVESVLAQPVARRHLSAGYLAVGAVGTLVIMAASGFGMGVAYAIVSGDAGQIGRMTAATLVAVPAVLVLLGGGALIFGVWPAAMPAIWGALAVTVLAGYFGDLLRLPGWARQLSSFEHLPALPAETMRWAPVAVMLVLSAVLVAAGQFAFARRDIEIG